MSLLTDLLNLNLCDYTDKIIAEYIWIGGSGIDMRSKGRTLSGSVSNPSEIPKWSFDGSNTAQASGYNTEVILHPQAIFRDPFRRGNNILVICDTYSTEGDPIPSNKRASAQKIFSQPAVVAQEPRYGIKQDYTLLHKDMKWPIGWPVGGYPGPHVSTISSQFVVHTGPYYCGTGAEKAYGRDIVNAHYKACLTKDMRGEGGLEVVQTAIRKLQSRHKEHICAYGDGNDTYLASTTNTFSVEGVAKREASIRAGRETEKNGKGYLEDRRPASNMDPYVVTSMIAETTLLWKPMPDY
eukprot:Gb_00897 [translate_table: standard]